MRPLLILICTLLFTTPAHAERVKASWYGPQHHGRLMANGQRFNQWADTVAHRTIPLGTRVRITRPDTGKTVIATVTDRGPYIRGRDLDVSRGVAHRLGFIERGVVSLNIQIIR